MEDQSTGSWSWNANAYSARQKTISASSKCEEYDLDYIAINVYFYIFQFLLQERSLLGTITLNQREINTLGTIRS